MSQRERRSEPYPWTWEPAAVTCTVIAAVLIVAVQLGRAVANLTVGGAVGFPATTTGWVTSLPAVLSGDGAAGLAGPGHQTAGPTALAWSIAGTAVLLLGLAITAAVLAWRWWGPGDLHGAASPDEVRATLGVSRLHRNRHLIRPDLYGARQKDTR